MQKPTKQTVYTPVKEGDSEMSVSYWEKDTHITDVKEQEGYFFTTEQLNEYTQHVINQTLKTAAKEATTKFIPFTDDEEEVDKSSILGLFELIFNKLKV